MAVIGGFFRQWSRDGTLGVPEQYRFLLQLRGEDIVEKCGRGFAGIDRIE